MKTNGTILSEEGLISRDNYLDVPYPKRLPQ